MTVLEPPVRQDWFAEIKRLVHAGSRGHSQAHLLESCQESTRKSRPQEAVAIIVAAVVTVARSPNRERGDGVQAR